MSYVRVDSSVPRNRKFVQAGPAPSWLWLCGLAYCQEGLTDGFIPTEAIDYLGVKNARRLADHLVRARLWDVADGGWRVHDYLEHNKPASEIRRVNRARAEGGNLGGRPNKTSEVADKVNHTENPSVSTATAKDSSTATETTEGDVLFARFLNAYPVQGRRAGRLVQEMFLAAVNRVGADRLFEALDNHNASEQWTVARKIPGMDTWLKSERWNQRLDPPKSQWGDWQPGAGRAS